LNELVRQIERCFGVVSAGLAVPPQARTRNRKTPWAEVKTTGLITFGVIESLPEAFHVGLAWKDQTPTRGEFDD
jgi:hypothetical protein